MSLIELTSLTKLENTSIQYSYPEMNIKNISKTNDVVNFFFQASITTSMFTFIHSNTYLSGTPTQGIISKSIHTGDRYKYDYELTIKHISPTESEYFYVVFPLTNGGDSTIIDKIYENAFSSSSNIDIYADEYIGASNKGLNDIIKSSFNIQSKIYKYKSSGTGTEKHVFVFEQPLKVNISKGPTYKHDLWTKAAGKISHITSDDNVQVLEEIECDYSGDSIEEPSINNKNLSTTFSKIGSISIFFAVFALYTAFFYTYLTIGTTNKDNIISIAYIFLFLLIIFLASFLPNSIKNINFFNINFAKPASFYSLLFIPLWDILYKLVALFIYSSIYSIPDPIFNFLFSFFKTDNLEIKGYNQFLLGLLLVIWVLFVCVILVK